MSCDKVEKTVLLRAPLSSVWRGISDSTQFGIWFGVAFAGPFEAGATVKGQIVPTKVDKKVAAAQQPYEGTPFEILVDAVIPESLFSFRWHPFAVDPVKDYSSEPMTLVTFILEEVSEGVRLTVTETGFETIPAERRAEAFRMNDEGWTGVLTLIEGYLALAIPQP